jgi:acetyl esterase/lipase
MRDCVVDCRDGLRFLKKHEDLLGVDMDKVVIFGDSAGGHLTQMLTFSSPDAFIGDADLASYHAQPAAGVSWYGPSDFTNQKLDESTYVDMKFKPGFWAAKINKSKQPLHYNSQSKVVKKMMEEVSPVTWLTKDSRPLLQIHGKQDSVISYAQGVHLKEKADKVGAPVTFLSVNHAGHGWHTKDMEPSFDAVTQKGVDFVLDHTVRK